MQYLLLLSLLTPPAQDRLVTACFVGDTASVDAALSLGADINAFGSNRRSRYMLPLAAAAHSQNLDLVCHVLSKGGDAAGRGVMTAAVRSTLQILETILHAGGDPNACDSDGGAVVLLAIKRAAGAREAVRLLLQCPDLDLTVVDVFGRTPDRCALERVDQGLADVIADEVGGRIGRAGDCCCWLLLRTGRIAKSLRLQ